jgi:hypothetical protein
MVQTKFLSRMLGVSSLVISLPLAAAAQGTSAASISGVVTDGSGGV